MHIYTSQAHVRILYTYYMLPCGLHMYITGDLLSSITVYPYFLETHFCPHSPPEEFYKYSTGIMYQCSSTYSIHSQSVLQCEPSHTGLPAPILLHSTDQVVCTSTCEQVYQLMPLFSLPSSSISSHEELRSGAEGRSHRLPWIQAGQKMTTIYQNQIHNVN